MQILRDTIAKVQAPYQHGDHKSHGFAEINQKRMAYIVGAAAISLPIIMAFGSLNPVWKTCFRDSISHFYYAPLLGSYFIGVLFFIGTYLFVYQGEDPNGRECKLATYASFCAFGVAIFPTSGHGCEGWSQFEARAVSLIDTTAVDVVTLAARSDGWGYFMLFPHADKLHYLSAGLLFAFLAWFALVVFTAVDANQRDASGALTPEKYRRNVIYYVSGTIMILCMAAMAYSGFLDDRTGWNSLNLTFWCEAIALFFFGLSWLIKGGFWGSWLGDKT